MSELLALTIVGVVTGSIYAVAASGLVVTYTTSGVFNIAHGAVGMLMAFLYWQVRFDWGWPAAASLAFVLLVAAPLLGVVIERTLARDLAKASLVSSLVVTIGLLLVLMGLALNVWPPEGRRVDGFFSPGGFDLGPVFVTWHQTVTVLVALAVAAGLRLLMFRTRAGVTMRAVVDHRSLASLVGARPALSSSLSWALGSSLAALAGILLAPVLQLNVQALTLLVVNAYAAAMVGRLRSVPLTFVGAMALGLIESYAVGYLPSDGAFTNLRVAIPTLMLFVILIAMPEVRLRAGSTVVARMPSIVSARGSVLRLGALVIAASAFAAAADEGTLSQVAPGLALGLVALSLVPLTGWAGQVSLCQMTFAGLGAFAMVKFGADGAAIGLLAAVAIAVPVGALVALPALRLRGLYLALATLAFAVLMDKVFFIRADVFGNLGAVRVERLNLAGVSLAGERAYFVLLATAFGVIAVALLALRRGSFGRRLSALRDSLHHDGPRHDGHEAAGLRLVLGHRCARRSALRGPASDGDSRGLHHVLEPAGRAPRRARWDHGGERRSGGRPGPGRLPGVGRPRVLAGGSEHPRARDHRDHLGSQAARACAPGNRHVGGSRCEPRGGRASVTGRGARHHGALRRPPSDSDRPRAGDRCLTPPFSRRSWSCDR